MRSSSKSGKQRDRSEGSRSDFGSYYGRNSSQNLNKTVSRLELARAYGMRASERNRRKQGSRPSSSPEEQPRRQKKPVKRSIANGRALYTEPIPENIACHPDAGRHPDRRDSYVDGSEHEVFLDDWVRCSSMYHSDISRDSQGSPISGQDPGNPMLLSSTGISETVSGASDRVDRGVQTCAESGVRPRYGGRSNKKIQTMDSLRDVASGQEGSILLTKSSEGSVKEELFSNQYLEKSTDGPYSGPSSSENFEEMELQKRVQELRKSVAAMRSEARMLELQTEERVLLKEMAALSGYMRNARQVMDALDRSSPVDGSTSPQPHLAIGTNLNDLEKEDGGTNKQSLEVDRSQSMVVLAQASPKEEATSSGSRQHEGLLDSVSRDNEVCEMSENMSDREQWVTNSHGMKSPIRDELNNSTIRDQEDGHEEEHHNAGVTPRGSDLDTPRGHQGRVESARKISGQSISAAGSDLVYVDSGRLVEAGVEYLGNAAGRDSSATVDVIGKVHGDIHVKESEDIQSPVNTTALELSENSSEEEIDDSRGIFVAGRENSGTVFNNPVAAAAAAADADAPKFPSPSESNLVERTNDESDGDMEINGEYSLTKPVEADQSALGGEQGNRPASEGVLRSAAVSEVPLSSPFALEADVNEIRLEDAYPEGPDEEQPQKEDDIVQRDSRWSEDSKNEYQDDVDLSLEERSMQMIMRMHEDQVRESGDYIAEGGSLNESPLAWTAEEEKEEMGQEAEEEMEQQEDEEMEDENHLMSSQEVFVDEQNDHHVLMELERMEKEIVRASMESEESEGTKLDMSPRTWRLDFDINEVEDCSASLTASGDLEADELLADQETNRESTSSRELSTRTDCDYIEDFIEEVMRIFEKNIPDFSCSYSAPVPWKVFLDIQLARNPNKDQSIFDRCIFEALNEAVTDTYRTCNRVLKSSLKEGEKGQCIPLPEHDNWISDVKGKVLRAVNHRGLHVDAIGAILSQDAFFLHGTVMNLHDELEELHQEAMHAL